MEKASFGKIPRVDTQKDLTIDESRDSEVTKNLKRIQSRNVWPRSQSTIHSTI